jgi:hypothetical protein
MEAAYSFVEGIGDLEMKQQILVAGGSTLNVALNQA